VPSQPFTGFCAPDCGDEGPRNSDSAENLPTRGANRRHAGAAKPNQHLQPASSQPRNCRTAGEKLFSFVPRELTPARACFPTQSMAITVSSQWAIAVEEKGLGPVEKSNVQACKWFLYLSDCPRSICVLELTSVK